MNVNDPCEIWAVEQFVKAGNESFWHEKARFYRNRFQTEDYLKETARLVGRRDVTNYGGRYRIRVYKEETLYDSEEGL